MRKILFYTTWIAGGCLSTALYGQTADRPVETRIVEVVHNFEGNIIDTDRLPLLLTVNDSVALFHSSFTYKPEPVALSVFSLAKNIPPAIVEEKQANTSPNGYARIGTGFPLSPFGDLYLHKLSGNALLNLYYNHRSYWGNLPLLKDPSASNALPASIAGHHQQNDAGVSAQWRTPSLTLYVDADYSHRYLLFHGHDTASLRNATPEYIQAIRDNSSVLRRTIGQTYHLFTAKAGVASHPSPDRFSYSLDARFDYTHGAFAGINEYAGGVNGKLSQPFKTVHSADVSFKAIAYNKGNAPQWSDGLFAVTFAYVYHKDNFKLSAGVNVEGVYASYNGRPARDSGKLSMGVYPNIRVTRKFSDYFSLYASLKGETQCPTYRSMIEENSYILPTLAVDNIRTPVELSLGMSGRVFNLIGYHLFGRYAAIDSLPFYVNSDQQLPAGIPAGYLGNHFDVRYQKTRLFAMGVDIDFTTADFEAVLRGRYHSWSFPSAPAQAWHKPAWELGGDVRYKYEKYTFQGGFYSRGAMPVYYRTALSGEVTTEIASYFDLSLQAEYRINKWLTAFVYGRNLLNQQYQHYYLYYAPGVTAGAGVTFVW